MVLQLEQAESAVGLDSGCWPSVFVGLLDVYEMRDFL